MQKTKFPPVDMRHVCKYTDEIIEKLKKKKWSYDERFNIWVNSANVCGFMHCKDSFTKITETSNDKEFFKLPEFSYKTLKGLEAIFYTMVNDNTFYGVGSDLLTEIIRALGKQPNKKTISDIVLGFIMEREGAIIAFISYKDDYARFAIGYRVINDDKYLGSAIISGRSYKEPYYLFYDIKTGIIGPLYKGKIITMDDYKAKWVEHILSNT